jgi:spore germination protein GerM
MSTITRHSNTCMIKMAKSSKMTEAVVESFEDKVKLNVIINKAIKINMKWNGQKYEGRSAGMDFESNGPDVSKTQTGVRG